MSIINSHAVALKRSAAEKIAADRQKYLDAGGVIYYADANEYEHTDRAHAGMRYRTQQNLQDEVML